MNLFKDIYSKQFVKSKTALWVQLMTLGAKSGCHQFSDRSFFIHGCQFPICARCTGVLIGYLLTVIVFPFYLLDIKWCLCFCGIMFADWLIQHLKIRSSTNIRRLITGILGGFGLFTLELNIILLAAKSIF